LGCIAVAWLGLVHSFSEFVVNGTVCNNADDV